jgi:hypothetical protein
VKGKSIGLQAFMVPIRDLKSHKVFEGIEVGDINSKYGF